MTSTRTEYRILRWAEVQPWMCCWGRALEHSTPSSVITPALLRIPARDDPIITSNFNRDGSKDILIAYQQTRINTNVFEIFNNTGGNRITFTVTPNPSSFGQTVTLLATVTATQQRSGHPAPTGIIMFMDGTTLLGTVTLNKSKATFSTSTLSVGTPLSHSGV